MNLSTDASIDPLDRLITELNDTDVRVAQAALERYEPVLRMVVRRQLGFALRSKLDSMDVVQSIWTDLLVSVSKGDRRFQDASQLRAFLARVARNRLIDHRRKHRRAIESDRPIDTIHPSEQPRQNGPRASEVVRGHELWDRMLAVCPTSHREILRLKLGGSTLTEIANRCGLHEGSVRRILYNLAKTVRVSDSESVSA